MTQLEHLLKAYVELNKLHAEPGQRCHMLAMSIQFLQRQIRDLLKTPRGCKEER